MFLECLIKSGSPRRSFTSDSDSNLPVRMSRSFHYRPASRLPREKLHSLSVGSYRQPSRYSPLPHLIGAARPQVCVRFLRYFTPNSFSPHAPPEVSSLFTLGSFAAYSSPTLFSFSSQALLVSFSLSFFPSLFRNGRPAPKRRYYVLAIIFFPITFPSLFFSRCCFFLFPYHAGPRQLAFL